MTDQTNPAEAVLEACPFCGGDAEIEQVGDRRQSTIYACTMCGCRLETGEEWGHGAAWNTRPAPVASPIGADVEGMRKAIATAIYDPGQTEGYMGDRSLTDWQTDAVMRALSARPIPADEPTEAMVAVSQDKDIDALSTLAVEFGRWIAAGPNMQPHYKSGMRPFSTGDLKHMVRSLDNARHRLAALSARPQMADGAGEATRAEIDAADAYWRERATHEGELMFALPGTFFWCELIQAVHNASPASPPGDGAGLDERARALLSEMMPPCYMGRENCEGTWGDDLCCRVRAALSHTDKSGAGGGYEFLAQPLVRPDASQAHHSAGRRRLVHLPVREMQNHVARTEARTMIPMTPTKDIGRIDQKDGLYRSQGYAMCIDHTCDYAGDPTVEIWRFANEDDGSDGDGWLEVRVDEIVQTERSGTLAVYYRRWMAPDGEPAWGRKPRRVVGSLGSLKALIRRRKMLPVEGAQPPADQREGEL